MTTPCRRVHCILLTILIICSISKSISAANDKDQADFERRSREHIERILLGGGVHPEQANDNGDDDITVPINVDELPENHIKALHKLRDVYQKKIRPLENQFHYEDLKRHLYTDADIFAKPIVLLVGPWSTGKTTIINYILGTENTLEELYVGAEPTTSDFTVLSHGASYKTVEGIVLASDATKPFSPMEKFGQVFLEHLLGIEMPRDILRNVTFIDTPGILENRRQQERGYPYNDVLRWLVARSDLIFVVFDPTKLDVGTELEALFKQLKGHESVVRIVLNKADSMAEQDLMRVYGTLFWSLAPLINVTEPPRIYVGSFWSQPYTSPELKELLTKEEKSLLKDMRDVMRNQVQNKIASIRQHAIRVRIHALLIDSYLAAFRKNKGMFSAGEDVAETIADYPDRYNVYKAILAHPNVSKFDLPDKEEYRDFFRINAMNDLKRISEYCSSWSGGCSIDKLNQAIGYDLPSLLNQVIQSTKGNKGQDHDQQEHCDKKDKSCTDPKKQTNKYKVDGAAKKAEKIPTSKPKKSKNSKGSLPKRSKEDNSDSKQKNKILVEASPEHKSSGHSTKHIKHQQVQEDEDQSSEEDESDSEDENESRVARAGKEDEHHHTSLAEDKAMLETKLACLYRKSCYVTGIKPKIEVVESKPAGKEKKQTKQTPKVTEADALKDAKFKCLYRPSCYRSNKIPFTKPAPVVMEKKKQDPSKTKSVKSKEKGKPTETSASDQKSECRYRKSCYKSGIVPTNEDLAKLWTKQKAAPPAIPEDHSKLSEESLLKKMKFHCQYRKSCYGTNKKIDLEAKASEHVAQKSKQRSEHKEEQRLLHEAKAGKFDCKYRKSCEMDAAEKPGNIKQQEQKPVKVKQEQPRDKPESKKPKTSTSAKSAKTETQDEQKLASKDGKKTKQEQKAAQKLSQKPVETKKGGSDSKTKSKEQTDAEKKFRCKYRKECYKTGTVPDLKQLAYKAAKEKASKTAEPKKADIKQASEADKKFLCKYRKDCYKTGRVPDLTKQYAEPKKHKESKKPKEVHIETASVTDKKFLCKYRKNCYETGIVPDLSKKAQSLPQKTESKKPRKIDVVALSETEKKFACKYRKECYKTGKVPNLAVQQQYDSKKSKADKQKVEIAHEDSEREKKFKCMYRKSCYDTGVLQKDYGTKTDKSYKKKLDVQKPAEHKSPKKDCKYRKSCLENEETKTSTKQYTKHIKENKDDKQSKPIKSASKSKTPPPQKRSEKPVKVADKKSKVKSRHEEKEQMKTKKEKPIHEDEDDTSSEEVRRPKKTADSEEDFFEQEAEVDADDTKDMDDNNHDADDGASSSEEEEDEQDEHASVGDASHEEQERDIPETIQQTKPSKKIKSTTPAHEEKPYTSKPKSKTETPVQSKKSGQTQTPTKPCNKWRKDCPEYEDPKVPKPQQTNKISEPTRVKSVIKSNQPCTKWRRNCPEYEDPRLVRQAKEEAKKSASKEIPVVHHYTAMPKKCNKWHKNCPEYTAWKAGIQIKASQEQFKVQKDPHKPADKGPCNKWKKGCPEYNESKQKTKQSDQDVHKKQTTPVQRAKTPTQSNKEQKYRKTDPKAHMDEDQPRQHRSTSRPPEVKDGDSGEVKHSKCGPYRKSCDTSTNQGKTPDAVPQKDINNSLPCNKYRKSCRESLGLPVNIKEHPNGDSKKKLCRKDKS